MTSAEHPGEATQGARFSIFFEQDDRIRGEALVHLQTQAMSDESIPVPSGPLHGTFSTATDFGIPALAPTLEALGAQSVTHLHPPAPTQPAGTMAFAKPASSLSADYRIRYKPEVPINEAVGMLGALDEVELAEPNRWREIQTAGQAHDALPWGIVRTKCPDAWKRSVGERGVTVAVVDTGVHLSHPDLSPALIDGKDLVDLGPQPTAPPGWVFEGDFMGLDSSPQDEVGHGTHVAGVICCRPNESAGVAGMTWTCTLRPVRVLARIRNRITNRVSGVGSAADIAAGIRWAVDQGVRVINLSLGGYRATSVERRAIEYAINHDVAVIAAMGNDNTSTPSYPAAFPGVIAVGATTEDDQKAAFSNVGPHISVCAPGVDIMSTYWGDRLYASLDGTSMASPHVAGLAALVLSRNPGLTASSMSQVIRDTARPLLGNPSGTVPNHQYGSGIIDAQAAVP